MKKNIKTMGRISTMVSFVLKEMVGRYLPGDPHPMLESDHPNGFIVGDKTYYWKIKRIGSNGSLSIAIVWEDKETKRFRIVDSFHIRNSGHICPNLFFSREECSQIRAAALAKYKKLPMLTYRNLDSSYTRLQTTITF